MSQILYDKALVQYGKPIGTLLLMVGCIGSSHAATYKIEPNNSNVRFAIDHFKTSATTGGFYNVIGLLRYDPRAKTGDISLVIPINSLNTGNRAFNLKLMGPEFFDMERFPFARFESTKWHFTPDKENPKVTRVDGKLTLHGETHPISLLATKFDCYLTPTLKKSVCGGNFTTTIDRTKWNIKKYSVFGLTKNLTLNIQVEAAKQ
ncbi:polyisoprenoid-binding protein [Psychrobacter frigidicola]|uniref:Polyisoprenoid-binding protein n=1 Tax=Psychrobacter frigidicola TaxID=45611 RepID=A0A5C7A737_9GAMM|nr:YceI family protein [Psychrobacter frigidicola]TXD98470.1 polyisoprenoid-binding protein [Psychrobacter frigidicola]